jgi:hypothetical protein
MSELQYAVIGRSETYPILYHMNQTRPNADLLCQRREAAIKRACFVVAMGEWAANPLTALVDAEAARGRAEESATRTRQDRYAASGRWP